jgi:hypothetical protein
MMTRHQYSRRQFIWDETKAVIGLILTGGPLFFADIQGVVFAILAVLTVLFVGYAAQTALRHLTVIEVSDDGIAAVGARPANIPWDRLRGIRLRYYSTRRDREQGWMHLVVKGDGTTIRIESAIDSFTAIVSRVTLEAEQHGVELGASTRINLDAIGVANGGVTNTATK